MQAAVSVHCSHPVTPGGHAMASSAAACCIQPMAHALQAYFSLSMGMTQQFRFLFLVTLTFDLDIQTHPSEGQNRLPSKFGANPFSRSWDILYRNKKNKKVTVLKTEPYLCAVKMTKVSHNGLTLRIKQVVKAVGISHSINTIEYDADSTFSINESIIDM